MKKNKKRLKLLATSLIMGSTASVSLGLVSCYHEPTNSWDNFIKAAKAETAIKIVGVTTPTDWTGATADQLSISDFNASDSTNVVTLSITRKIAAGSTTATFEIDFMNNQAYDVQNWKINNQPIYSGWVTFKTAAIHETGFNIVKITKPFLWPSGDLQKDLYTTSDIVIDKINFKVTLNVTYNPGDIKQIMTVVIADEKNANYDVQNWKITVQPHLITKNWDAFKTAAKDETPINIVKATKLDSWKDAKDTELKSNNFHFDDAHTSAWMNIIRVKSDETSTIATFKINEINDAVYNVKDWTCNPKPHDDTAGWNDFIKTAKSEKPYFVVDATKPKGWDDAVAQELATSNFKADLNTRTITEDITRTDSDDGTTKASFTIIYDGETSYDLDDWKCSSKPKPSGQTVETWGNFLELAKAEPLANFVTKGTLPSGWKDSDQIFETSEFSKVDDTSVTRTFGDASISPSTIFSWTINFDKYFKYNASQWKNNNDSTAWSFGSLITPATAWVNKYWVPDSNGNIQFLNANSRNQLGYLDSKYDGTKWESPTYKLTYTTAGIGQFVIEVIGTQNGANPTTGTAGDGKKHTVDITTQYDNANLPAGGFNDDYFRNTINWTYHEVI